MNCPGLNCWLLTEAVGDTISSLKRAGTCEHVGQTQQQTRDPNLKVHGATFKFINRIIVTSSTPVLTGKRSRRGIASDELLHRLRFRKQLSKGRFLVFQQVGRGDDRPCVDERRPARRPTPSAIVSGGSDRER